MRIVGPASAGQPAAPVPPESASRSASESFASISTCFARPAPSEVLSWRKKVPKEHGAGCRGRVRALPEPDCPALLATGGARRRDFLSRLRGLAIPGESPVGPSPPAAAMLCAAKARKGTSCSRVCGLNGFDWRQGGSRPATEPAGASHAREPTGQGVPRQESRPWAVPTGLQAERRHVGTEKAGTRTCRPSRCCADPGITGSAAGSSAGTASARCDPWGTSP